MSKPPIILVDGSSYLYRAFHAMPGLNNSEGQPTGAIYGVINMTRSLLKQYQPEYIAMVFDAKGKTFRNDLYEEYKANRPPMPDELRSQVPFLYEIIEAMGLPLLVIEGVEADDVIGTLAAQAVENSVEVLISTGDKDMAQLVNEHVTLVNTMDNRVMDVEGVKARFGVSADRFIDYLTLVGDPSDNIPGVPKIGPKTAAKLLEEFGDLDTLMQRADEVKGKLGENLRDSLEFLPLSRDLVTIRCQLDLPLKLDELKIKQADESRLKDLYVQLQFKTWLTELGGANDQVSAEAEYETVLDQSSLDDWLNKIYHRGIFAFDTETTDLDAMQADIVGLSFAVEPGKAAYVPLSHDYPGAPEQLDRGQVLQQMKPLLENEEIKKIGQNLKYDMKVLANYAIALNGIEHDTMLESYVLDSTSSRHDMDTLAMKHLGHKTIRFEDIAGRGKKQLKFNDIALEQASPYAAEDADITLRLHEHLWPALEKREKLMSIYRDIEIPLLSILARVERNGVRIDAGMLKRQSSELALGIVDLERQAHEAAGQEFNLGSPAQLQDILFNKLGLPVIKKTPKGQPSTAEAVLQELAPDYDLPRLILEYRSMSKLRSTYTDKLPQMINPRTGRVHTSYHQAVAATGRLSSSDPNLQNIPVRSKEGRRIRQAFIPDGGFRMVSADYSQVELRIMAHLSGDEGLLKAFSEGADIHRSTASEVFATPLDEVTTDQRRSAKAINFGLIYGMSAFGLAQQLNIERGEAQEYIDLYFERYPGVKTYMDETRKLAHEQGYVETVYGRRLYLPEINSGNGMRRQYAERTAINAPMQGTAADLIKMAMISVDKWIMGEAQDVRMIMQVHDELVFEAPDDQVDHVSEKVQELMTGVAELRVPLLVDVGVGANWDEAH
ncbi:DNA polymerase I [bacterium BMS3Bbin11]|nr:DNA polymerase I [bacterium BMS3Abin11]GBE46816.1 DNA polymerase I [bacterium BMS3Bbin11]GMT39550.1 MAG: DNA polymerase I [bacterium]HDH16874.1 DNA polymerase I [Gammaproteobacteria bacterium]